MPAVTIDRYYDPGTDQFLSVDPLLSQTGQPYAFTGDDPLNVTDPLGLKGWYCIGGKTHYYKGNKFGAKGNGTCRQIAQRTLNAYAKLLELRKAGFNVSASQIGAAITSSGFAAAEHLDSSIGNSAQHLSDNQLESLAEQGTRYSNIARGVGLLGSGLTAWADLKNGRNLSYTTGDVVGSAAGGWGGAIAGVALCGGPEDGVSLICGALGGFDGGQIGGWLGRNLFGKL
jgi:hypothetical protein